MDLSWGESRLLLRKALAVHPNKGYTVVYHNSKPLVIATRTIEKLAPMLFYEGKYRKVANYMGSQLVGVMVTDPLSGEKIPIIADETVGESYTSIIPFCPSIYPAHFKLSEEYNLSRNPVVSIEGKIMARQNPDLDGLPLYKTASEAVIYLLVAKKAIADKSVEHETLLYRRKTDKAEQISMTTIPEWVVKLSETEISRYGKFLESKVKLSGTQVLDVDNLLLKLNNTSRMTKISGRNKFGIPLPFFRFKSQPNKYLISEKQVKHSRELFIKHGTRIWRDWDTPTLLHEDYLALAEELEPVQANMDESFESSLFWYYLQQKDRAIGSGAAEPVTDIMVVDAKNTNEWLRATAVTQALLQGAPTVLEVKTHPSLVNTEGQILETRGPTEASQALSIVEGSIKLNEDQQYGMGAEVFRLWAASIDFSKPRSNSIVFDESLLSKLLVSPQLKNARNST